MYFAQVNPAWKGGNSLHSDFLPPSPAPSVPVPQLRLAHLAGTHRDPEGCVNSPVKHHHERNSAVLPCWNTETQAKAGQDKPSMP